MGGRVGGLTHKFHRENKGIKVTGGQHVKAGTVLTRQGHKWRPGLNVAGQSHLTAVTDGTVYFTKRKNNYNKIVTVINIKTEKAKTKKKPAKAKAE